MRRQWLSGPWSENIKKENKSISFSKEEQEKLNTIQDKIKEINLILLDFQFKNATRQPIKPHEIKIAKKERARLITKYWEIYSGQETCLPL
jgi:ribosomal protein L29